MAPGRKPLWFYDRGRILHGELWRLVTCNWVHFSTSHLAYDLLVFGIAGSLIEQRRGYGFRSFCVLAPPVIGVAVFLFRPDLEIFGGLSGLATGAIVLLALYGLRKSGPWRWICLLALIAFVMKTVFEFINGQPIFADSQTLTIKSVPEAHIAGAATALLIWLWQWLRLPSRDNAISSLISKSFGGVHRYVIGQGTVCGNKGVANGVRRHVQFAPS